MKQTPHLTPVALFVHIHPYEPNIALSNIWYITVHVYINIIALKCTHAQK